MTVKEQTPGPGDQAALPVILVAASDPKLLKLLHMALSLEFACQVLPVESVGRAEEAARGTAPALLIVDEQFFHHHSADLSTRLHCIAGLEHLPTLFVNMPDLPQNGHQSYPARFLGWYWKVEAFYAAVQALLRLAPSGDGADDSLTDFDGDPSH